MVVGHHDHLDNKMDYKRFQKNKVIFIIYMKRMKKIFIPYIFVTLIIILFISSILIHYCVGNECYSVAGYIIKELFPSIFKIYEKWIGDWTTLLLLFILLSLCFMGIIKLCQFMYFIYDNVKYYFENRNTKS